MSRDFLDLYTETVSPGRLPTLLLNLPMDKGLIRFRFLIREPSFLTILAFHSSIFRKKPFQRELHFDVSSPQNRQRKELCILETLFSNPLLQFLPLVQNSDCLLLEEMLVFWAKEMQGAENQTVF